MLPPVHLVRANQGDFLVFGELSGISTVLFATGQWDSKIISYALSFLQAINDRPLVLDIGGNLGTFTVPIAKSIESKCGHVLVFEPQQTIFYQLCGNIFLNRLDNVTAHNIALSNKTGIYLIPSVDFEKAHNNGSFSVIKGNPWQPIIGKNQRCQFAEIDDFEIEGRISLIKLDVEGSEFDILSSGMKRITRDGFPPIIFEIFEESEKTDLFNLLMKHGYKIYNIPEMKSDFFAVHPSWSAEFGITIKNGVLWFGNT